MTDLVINLAPHATEFLKELRKIALGEFIPYDWLISNLKTSISEDSDMVDSGDGYLD